MKKSKIFSLLPTFSKKELKDFRLFLQKLYGQKKNALAILRYIEPFHPNYDDPKLERTYAFRKIFGFDKPFKLKTLHDALSELFLLAKEFLLWQALKEPSFDKDWLLLNILKKRKAEKLFEQEFKRVEKEVNNFNNEYYFQKSKLLFLKYYSSPPIEFPKRGSLLSEAVDYLDKYYVNSKFQHSAELKTRENFYPESYNYFLISEILEKIDILLLDNYSKLQILVFQLIQNPTSENGHKLKTVFFKHSDFLSPDEWMGIFTCLTNFASKQINQGKLEYYSFIFEVFDFGINIKKILLKNNYLSPNKFGNAINIACNLQKFKWAEDFIKNCQGFLPKDFKNEAVSIALGELEFSKSNFSESIEILVSIEFPKINYALRAKTILLKSYYETNLDFEQLLAYCKAFEQFIRRKQLNMTPWTYQSHLNFIIYTRHLIMKNNSSEIRLKLEKEKNCISKPWLLAKWN